MVPICKSKFSALEAETFAGSFLRFLGKGAGLAWGVGAVFW
mgnify:CR=1 FL=1